MTVYVSELYVKEKSMWGYNIDGYVGCSVFGNLHDIMEMLKAVNPPSERKHRSITKVDDYIVVEYDSVVNYISRREVRTGL